MKRLTILCTSGAIIEQPDSLRLLIRDFAAIKGAKLLVHGGGEMADTFARKMGIKPKTAKDGGIIISNAMIDVLTMVHGGLINKRLVALLQRVGMNAVGLTGADMNLLVASRRNAVHGWKGEVMKVNTPLLQQLLDGHVVPVLAPIAYDTNAQAHYLDAEEIARVVARVLSLTWEISIIYLTSRHGVLMNESDPDSVIASLNRSRYANLKEMGIIAAAGAALVESAFASIDQGVKSVYITSVDRLGALDQGTKIS